jgi:hypothetical protein
MPPRKNSSSKFRRSTSSAVPTYRNVTRNPGIPMMNAEPAPGSSGSLGRLGRLGRFGRFDTDMMSENTNISGGMFALRVILLLIGLVLIGLNVWFLYYVDNLEKSGCQCAVGWKRSFMEVALVVLILVQILTLVLDWRVNYVWLSLVFQVLFIFYLLVTRSFIKSVESDDCKCAETRALWWLNFINILQLIGLAVTYILVFITILIIVFSKKN